MGRAIRTEKFRMVEWKKKGTPTEYELYDYSDAPYETKNIAAEKPTRIEETSSHPCQVPGTKGPTLIDRKWTCLRKQKLGTTAGTQAKYLGSLENKE